jgi:hypothetical protein
MTMARKVAPQDAPEETMQVLTQAPNLVVIGPPTGTLFLLL